MDNQPYDIDLGAPSDEWGNLINDPQYIEDANNDYRAMLAHTRQFHAAEQMISFHAHSREAIVASIYHSYLSRRLAHLFNELQHIRQHEGDAVWAGRYNDVRENVYEANALLHLAQQDARLKRYAPRSTTCAETITEDEDEAINVLERWYRRDLKTYCQEVRNDFQQNYSAAMDNKVLDYMVVYLAILGPSTLDIPQSAPHFEAFLVETFPDQWPAMAGSVSAGGEVHDDATDPSVSASSSFELESNPAIADEFAVELLPDGGNDGPVPWLGEPLVRMPDGTLAYLS